MKAAGDRWQNNKSVYASRVGTELDAHNVHRPLQTVLNTNPRDATQLRPVILDGVEAMDQIFRDG